MSAPTIWSEEVVARLKQLCADSLPNTAIAKILSVEFNIVVTRNACIGKRARSGIPTPPGIARPRKQRKPVGFRRSAFRQPPHTVLPIANGHEISMPTVFPHACGLLDLTNTSCRYSYGDVGKPGFFFCGTPDANLIEGRPYCDAHAQVVWRRT